MPTTTNLTSQRIELPPQAVSGIRVLFMSLPSDDLEIVSRFSDPRPMVAVQQVVDADELLASTVRINQLEIITVENVRAGAQKYEFWIEMPIQVSTDLAKVSWQAGRALVHATTIDGKIILPALIEFAYYEGELRKLEEAIAPHEATAQADVKLAYEMTAANQNQWDRLYQTIEQLYGLRLQFARLEPHLYRASPSLPVEGRRLFSRLAAKAQVADRLEALSDRLEACEDLYEGAADRITDFKMYRKGNLLEVAIVILLAVEVVLLVMQGHHF